MCINLGIIMGRTVEGMTKKTTSGDKIILQPPPPAKKQKMKTGVAIATMTKSEEEEYPDDYVEATPYGTVTKCFLLKELPNGLCIGGRLLVRMSTSTHNAKPEPMVFFQIGEFKKVEGKKWENVNDTLRTYCLETFCKMLEKLPVMVQNIPKLKEAELEKLINAPTKPLRLSQCDCNCLRRKKKKC